MTYSFAQLEDIKDKSRVRSRMGLDASEWSRLLKSEIDNYSHHFTPAEIKTLKTIVKDLSRIRKSCLG